MYSRTPQVLGGDAPQGGVELVAAVAAQRVEDVAGQALGMDADEHVVGALDVAVHERDVVLARQLLAEGDRLELAVLRRQPDGDLARDQLLVAAPVLDQVGDADELQLVARAVRDQVGDAGHRPVLVHDLADDPGGVQAGQAREVDRRLGLARAAQDAAVAGAQREDVARA